MKKRIFAATTLVFASVCVSDPASAAQRGVQPQGCGNLTAYAGRLAQDFGWTREQAIGALANVAHESRGRAIEQMGVRAGSGGFGWAQWTGARRYAFMAFARASGLDPTTDAANYAFLSHELRTNFAFVAQRMRQARSAAEATVIFARDYEGAFGPGAITSMASRHQWARALGATTAGTAAAAPAYRVARATPAAPAYAMTARIFKAAAPIYATAMRARGVSAVAYRATLRTYGATVPAYGAGARTYRAFAPTLRAWRPAPIRNYRRALR